MQSDAIRPLPRTRLLSPVAVRALGTEMASNDASDDASDCASECMLIAISISWPPCAPRATRDS